MFVSKLRFGGNHTSATTINDNPEAAKTIEDIVLDGEWCKTLGNEDFVLPRASNDTLIFTGKTNLQFLSQCKTIYVDGTFKSCPKPFTQVYSIHGLYGGYVVPLVYALLTDKSATTYYNIFGKVRDAMSAHKLIFNPIYIVSDFESSLPEAINLQFPNATYMGCHFHFGQALWRRVQAVGLVTKYREEQPVRTFIECCNALAFIPIGEVSSEFSELVAQLSDSDKGQLAPFIDYFKLTWLSGTFPLQLWNKYGCDKHHRTNNAMENWHGRINKLLPTHLNIFIFINAIKDDQANAQITMAKADVGQSPPHQVNQNTASLKIN